jgi:hypothetical protein
MENNSHLQEEIIQLREANTQLLSQLEVVRQKASLYYITSSELESLRRKSLRTVPNCEAGTMTETEDSATAITNDVGTQTHSPSESVLLANEIEMLRAEVEILKTINALNEKTERKRIDSLRALAYDSGTPIPDTLLLEYSSIFREYLRSNHMSINHSFEIRKRDNMIESLLGKIKLLETSFTHRLANSESVASSREQVIKELGNQIRDVLADSSAGSEVSVDWMTLAAMHAEMEDLKAELSKARTNWAATRDELMRLRYTKDDASDEAFPRPIMLIGTRSDVTTLSRIRNLRPV